MSPDMKRLCEAAERVCQEHYWQAVTPEVGAEAIVRAVLTELREVGYEASGKVDAEIGDPDSPLATGIRLSRSEVGATFVAVVDHILAEPATA